MFMLIKGQVVSPDMYVNRGSLDANAVALIHDFSIFFRLCYIQDRDNARLVYLS